MLDVSRSPSKNQIRTTEISVFIVMAGQVRNDDCQWANNEQMHEKRPRVNFNMAAPYMQLRFVHPNYSMTGKDCTRTGQNLRIFRKLRKSLAILGILKLSCQGLGILEVSWQGHKSTGVSVRVAYEVKKRYSKILNVAFSFSILLL